MSSSSERFATAVAALAATDPVIERLAAETGPVRIPRPRSTHFASLVQAIVFQQLAYAAAHAIHGRLVDALGGVIEPERVVEMSDEQMELQLKETVKNLFHLRFQSATDRLETPSEIQKAKRDVARLLTIKRERELGLRGQKKI